MAALHRSILNEVFKNTAIEDYSKLMLSCKDAFDLGLHYLSSVTKVEIIQDIIYFHGPDTLNFLKGNNMNKNHPFCKFVLRFLSSKIKKLSMATNDKDLWTTLVTNNVEEVSILGVLPPARKIAKCQYYPQVQLVFPSNHSIKTVKYDDIGMLLANNCLPPSCKTLVVQMSFDHFLGCGNFSHNLIQKFTPKDIEELIIEPLDEDPDHYYSMLAHMGCFSTFIAEKFPKLKVYKAEVAVCNCFLPDLLHDFHISQFPGLEHFMDNITGYFAFSRVLSIEEFFDFYEKIIDDPAYVCSGFENFDEVHAQYLAERKIPNGFDPIITATKKNDKNFAIKFIIKCDWIVQTEADELLEIFGPDVHDVNADDDPMEEDQDSSDTDEDDAGYAPDEAASDIDSDEEEIAVEAPQPTNEVPNNDDEPIAKRLRKREDSNDFEPIAKRLRSSDKKT